MMRTHAVELRVEERECGTGVSLLRHAFEGQQRAALLIIVVAVTAGAIPAIRAARLNPVTAMRVE